MVASVLPGVVDVLCGSGEGLEGEVGVNLEAGGHGDGVGEAVDMVAGALPDAWRRSSRGWAASTRSSAVGSERRNARASVADMVVRRRDPVMGNQADAVSRFRAQAWRAEMWRAQRSTRHSTAALLCRARQRAGGNSQGRTLWPGPLLLSRPCREIRKDSCPGRRPIRCRAFAAAAERAVRHRRSRTGPAGSIRTR